MLIIPLNAVPSQTLTTNLAGQISQINVYQKFFGLFVDLYVNNVLVIGGVVAEDRNRIVRSIYLGFDGDLAFADTQGTDDPDYTGLGARFQFAYLTAVESASSSIG